VARLESLPQSDVAICLAVRGGHRNRRVSGVFEAAAAVALAPVADLKTDKWPNSNAALYHPFDSVH
jgi:hypothetical protein